MNVPRTPSVRESLVDFDNPPVSEVVCGLGFQNPADYSTPHMGLFWSSIRDEFPHVQVSPPLPPPGPITLVASDTPPPPRYILKNKGGNELIQVQDTWFFYNWVRLGTDNEYPHYNWVMSRFHEHRQRFEKFVEGAGIGKIVPKELRLTYVNHIPEGQGWNKLESIGRVFPDFKYRRRTRRYLRPPRLWNIVTNHPVEDERARLEVSIRSGSRRRKTMEGTEEEQKLFIMQLSVIGSVDALSDDEMQSWFDMAREAIVLSFLDLTDDKVQRDIWRRHDKC